LAEEHLGRFDALFVGKRRRIGWRAADDRHDVLRGIGRQRQSNLRVAISDHAAVDRNIRFDAAHRWVVDQFCQRHVLTGSLDRILSGVNRSQQRDGRAALLLVLGQLA
jgi:hypothetical protein